MNIFLERPSRRSYGYWIGAFLVGIIIYFVFDEYHLIQRAAIVSWTENTEADCGVVLTGGQGRIQEGMSLLQQRRIKKLIISGVNPLSTLREIFPALPFYGEIDEKDIVLEKRSKTTYGNAQQSAPIIEALDCKSIVLITSKNHMRRAKQVFVSALPSEIKTMQRSVFSYPVDESLEDFYLEVIKSLFYRIWAY
ncbi:MAG: YdcF family protein [Bdellovibrionales bacterium]|nr:YdcF family protein [Bdellovibrionales bacterium]